MQIRNKIIQQSGDIINIPDSVKHYIDHEQLYQSIQEKGNTTMDIQRIHDILDAQKAEDINIIDVRHLTEVTDYMVICTARSSRHAMAISDNLAEIMKQEGFPALGIEGDGQSDWVLLDFSDCVVHVMLAETRAFYSLEKLWSITTNTREQQANE